MSLAHSPSHLGRHFRSRATVLFAIWMGCHGAVTRSQASDSAYYLARIQQALAHDDFSTAGRLLDLGLQTEPSNAALLAQRERLRQRQGGNSLPQFSSPAPLNSPSMPMKSAQSQAKALVQTGRLASAANVHRSILRANPNDLETRVNLGYTYFWHGQWREAQMEFAAVLQNDPRQWQARIGYLRAWHAAGRASAAYQHATELDRHTGERDPEVGLLLANIAIAVDADEQAEPLVTRVASDPEIQRLQTIFRAKRFVARGEKERGLALSGYWVKEHPGDYDSAIDLAELLITAGQLARAAEFYDYAAKLNPARPEAGLGLARVAFLQGKHRDSLDLYQRVTTQNPESLSAWLNVARLAQITGDPVRTQQALETATQLAPTSAHVYEARTQFAFQANDRATFQTTINAWATAQPADIGPDLWAQKWNHMHGDAVNLQSLQALLDPLNPEPTAEALKIIRAHSHDRGDVVMNEVPAAPTRELDAASQTKLSQQVSLRGPMIHGLAVGHEWSTLHDKSGAGAKLPDWQETYAAAFWGQPLSHTFSVDARRFERFGATAYQVLGSWGYEFTPQWSARITGGSAFSGDFIAKYRIGAGATYNFTPTFSGFLDFNFLSYFDAQTYQLVPGVTWQWHPQWATTAKVYASRNTLNGGSTCHSFSGALSTTWQFHPQAALQVAYSGGGENDANPVRNLIGEKGFQSFGGELKLNLSPSLMLAPEYRFETHNQFDMHTLALGLQWRY